MYSEAAACSASRISFVPSLRAIDLPGRTLYLDYVPAKNLRSLAARGGLAVHDADIKDDPHLCACRRVTSNAREVQLLDRAASATPARDRRDGAARSMRAAWCRFDIKLGNFIRGTSSGRLYWLDFELSRLRSQPRWDADLAAQRRTLEQLFDLAAQRPHRRLTQGKLRKRSPRFVALAASPRSGVTAKISCTLRSIELWV